MPRCKELAEALEIIETPAETETRCSKCRVSQQHHPVELCLHRYRGSQQAAGVSTRHAARAVRNGGISLHRLSGGRAPGQPVPQHIQTG